MRHRTSKSLISGAVGGLTVLMVVLGLFAAIGPQTALAATFTVTKTADTNDGVCDSDCSLREAIRAANAAAGPDTISIPAGTYTLTLAGSDDNANLGDLDVTGPLTINGAGQASTIIQAGTTNSNGIDKIFSFNPLGVGSGFAVSMSNLTLRFGKNPETFVSGNGFGGCFDFDSGTSGAGSLSMSNVSVSDCQTTQADGGAGAIFLTSGGTVSISNASIQNNTAHRPSPNFAIGGGLFFGCAGGSGATVTISGSTIANNDALDSGAQGGGLFLFGRCSGTPTLNYQLHNVTISSNQAANDGGGIYSTAPLTIDNAGGASVISNNSSGRSGGGVWLNHTNQTSSISKVTISGNSAADGGGGIRLDSASSGNVLNLSFSRIVNNTAGSGKGSGLSVNNGTANADNNWWGCSTGPSAAPCDTAKVDPASGGGSAGTGSVTFTPWLRVLATASPSTIVTYQSSSLTASVNTNSNNVDVSANNGLLKGLAVTWSAVGGTISGAQTTIQSNGTATATFTANAAGAGHADATVDNGTATANITINRPPTTVTSISRGAGSPTNAGGVTWTVVFANAVSGLTASNFALVNTGLGGAPAIGAVSPVGASPATSWTVTAGTGSGDGTLGLNLVNDTSLDHSLSNLPFTGQVYTIDRTAPTVTIDQAAGQPDPTDSAPINFTVVFDEPVSGFDSGDVTLSGTAGATTAVVTGGPTTYNVAVSGMTSSGTVIASIPASVASDAAGNGNAASTSTDNSVTVTVVPKWLVYLPLVTRP